MKFSGRFNGICDRLKDYQAFKATVFESVKVIYIF